MKKPTSHGRPRGMGAGFTLAELLVVIAIIALLMALLIPAVGRVRRAAWAADTQQRLNNLRSAIESYYAVHHAYPGLFSNDQIVLGATGVTVNWIDPVTTNQHVIGRLTMTENMTMSLTGGLRFVPNPPNPDIVFFEPAQVGRGQVSTNVANPQRYAAYIDATGAGLGTQPWVAWTGKLEGTGQFYVLGSATAQDSFVPEPLDGFPDAMPLLYFRAKVGAPGIADNLGEGNPSNAAFYGVASLAQYDLRQAAPYGLWWKGNDVQPDVPNAEPPGIGQFIEPIGGHVYDNVTDGVFGRGDFPTGPGRPWGYLSYFASDLSSVTTAVPKQKDTYMLISAGPDRKYGTADDQTSFGKIK